MLANATDTLYKILIGFIVLFLGTVVLAGLSYLGGKLLDLTGLIYGLPSQVGFGVLLFLGLCVCWYIGDELGK